MRITTQLGVNVQHIWLVSPQHSEPSSCRHILQVWDIRRLERDVSFASRLTYAGQSGRITSVCAVLDGASAASASSSGSLHVWRVEYTSKPGGWAPDKYRGGLLPCGVVAFQEEQDVAGKAFGYPLASCDIQLLNRMKFNTDCACHCKCDACAGW